MVSSGSGSGAPASGSGSGSGSASGSGSGTGYDSGASSGSDAQFYANIQGMQAGSYKVKDFGEAMAGKRDELRELTNKLIDAAGTNKDMKEYAWKLAPEIEGVLELVHALSAELDGSADRLKALGGSYEDMLTDAAKEAGREDGPTVTRK